MDNELLPKALSMIDRILRSGPIGITAAALIVLSAALFFVWGYLACKRRRLFPLLATGAAILAGGGLWLQHHLWTLRTYNLTSVQLLPGYKLVQGSDTDSYGGSISRPDGLHIQIDIGPMSGLWADPSKPEKHLWVFQQTIRGHTVFIGIRPHGDHNTEKLLCVTYPRGIVNFFAVVHSDQEIAEMLSMALTYEPNG